MSLLPQSSDVPIVEARLKTKLRATESYLADVVAERDGLRLALRALMVQYAAEMGPSYATYSDAYRHADGVLRASGAEG